MLKSINLALEAPSPEVSRFITGFDKKMIGLGVDAEIEKSGPGAARARSEQIYKWIYENILISR